MPYVRQRYIALASLFVTLGFLFLLNNFKLFSDFDLRPFWLVWPLALVLFGLYFVVRGTKAASFITASTAIITAIALFGFLATTSLRIPFLPTIETNRTSNINPNIEITNDSEKFNNNIEKANLIFRSERGDFTLRGTTNTLTEYEAKSTFGEYRFSRAQKDGIETVDLRFDQERFPWKLTSETNSVDLKLNDRPKWNLDYEVTTTSSLELDLGYYRVEKLRVKVSSTKTQINFEDKTFDKEIRFELDASNASSVNLRIPKNVGIELKLKTNLSSTNLADLKKVDGEDNTYRSENFNDKEKKLFIESDISLSSFRIDLY